jgi:transposase
MPAYAPDLNAAEGAWANMKTAWATSPPPTWTSSPRSSRTGKSIQYRPALIDAFLAQTGLSLEPEPPQTSAFQPL